MPLLKTIIFEFLLGYIMQGFVFVLGIYAFNRQKIVVKNYIMVSITASIIYFLVRLLPISFGVHTILNLLFLVLLSVSILKMPFYATIRSTLFLTIILLISEMANVALMISVLGEKKFQSMMLVPLEKAIAGLPGSFAFAIVIIISYFILTKKKK